MQRTRLRLAATAAIVGATFLILGCSNSGGVPSTAEVQKALGAFSDANSTIQQSDDYTQSSNYSSSPYTATVTNGNGGSASFTFTSSNPSGNPFQASGSITFTNWVDQTSGYTINGTVNVTESVSVNSTTETITLTITGTLNLSGGSISTLVYDMGSTMTIDMNTFAVTEQTSGTVTANGHPFDLSTLS